MDSVHGLPYTRKPHPGYRDAGEIPAWRTIADSEACRNRADTVEQRAFRLDTDLVVDVEFAAEKALGADEDVPAVMKRLAEPGRAPSDDEEREAWLRLVDAAPPTSRPSG